MQRLLLGSLDRLVDLVVVDLSDGLLQPVEKISGFSRAALTAGYLLFGKKN